jgi:hypothetical protein
MDFDRHSLRYNRRSMRFDCRSLRFVRRSFELAGSRKDIRIDPIVKFSTAKTGICNL